MGQRVSLMTLQRRETAAMDKDRVKDWTTNIGRKAKEAAGNLNSNAGLKGLGRTDQAKGKVQNAIGSISDVLEGR